MGDELVFDAGRLSLSSSRLSSSIGMPSLPTSSVARLRERIQREELEAAYREGRSLPFGAIAALTRDVLVDVARTTARPVPVAYSTATGELGRRPPEPPLGVTAD